MTHRNDPSAAFHSSLAGLSRGRGVVVGMLVAALVLFGLLPALHGLSHSSQPAHWSLAPAGGVPSARMSAAHDHGLAHAHTHAGHSCGAHAQAASTEPAPERSDTSCHTCVELLLASTLTSPGLSLGWAAPALTLAGLTPETLEGVLVARAIALSHARGPPIA